MKTTSCPQCHDTHFCPGPTSREIDASQEVRIFLEEQCVIRPGFNIQAINLYTTYRTWALSMGVAPLSLRRFGATIRALGFTTFKASVIYYDGISLKPTA